MMVFIRLIPVNLMERQFLSMVDFSLYVSVEEIDSIKSKCRKSDSNGTWSGLGSDESELDLDSCGDCSVGVLTPDLVPVDRDPVVSVC